MKVEYKQIVKRGLLLALVIIIIQNILLMLADVPTEPISQFKILVEKYFIQFF